MRRIAIIGGGISGLTAAYELGRQARDGAPVEAVLFESTQRLGGIVETVREGGFTVECGPDGWVSCSALGRYPLRYFRPGIEFSFGFPIPFPFIHHYPPHPPYPPYPDHPHPPYPPHP